MRETLTAVSGASGAAANPGGGLRPLAARAGNLGAPALIGIGLLGGVTAAAISPRRWGQIGAGLFGAGAMILRSAAGPVLVSAALTHWLTLSRARRERASAGATDTAP